MVSTGLKLKDETLFARHNVLLRRREGKPRILENNRILLQEFSNRGDRCEATSVFTLPPIMKVRITSGSVQYYSGVFLRPPAQLFEVSMHM